MIRMSGPAFHMSKKGYFVIDTPIRVDSNSKNADWLRVDAVELGLDTKEKFLSWLLKKGIDLTFYKTTGEWTKLVEAYPYAKEL
jgi:hypothetical protein